ncbi:rhomboid family intramembrane serine protease [Deinococcus peraridilitoris]|uniref:Putative membrane protein n=1 Tax=Deinococcus peraridilitoris (strain DSM 19664 / LMG 22246 / CIP 109416 / KR-200) TaxID=937777 RepID=L0A4K5_DEIPD|nr:rhomboid family intramembrane serine protease [Deinococcus peraridilitoris]AFZ67960.1 putative membrane protein [Deinococcus peraridilitoris DSM 19664]
MFPLYDDNRSGRVPWVTRTLIVLNILIFGYEFTLSEGELNRFIVQFGFIPASLGENLAQAGFSTLTSQFLHGGVMHLLGNVWFLWIFGDNIEDRYGHLPFLGLYLLWGVAAALSQAFFGEDPTVPMIGASGAISGVLGAYLVTYPRARIRTFVPIFIIFLLPWVRALIFLPYWLIIQIFSSQSGDSGVAFLAHIGGFVAGAVVALLPWSPAKRLL